MALGTMAVSAGVIAVLQVTAMVALAQMSAQRCGATPFDVAHGLEMGRQQRILVLVQERGLEGFDDG